MLLSATSFLTAKKRGVTLGGRGRGCLTAESIRKLQMYYSRAIRRAKTAEEMRRNILASVYHGYLTDDLPQHQFCVPGPDSWCFFKRSIGEHFYPTEHRKRVHTPLNYDLLHRYLKPIYDRLASLQLLRKCELKTTQNLNESFHHSAWSRCSKKNFHSLKRVEFALISAAAEFNSGSFGLKTVKQSLRLREGEHGQRLGAATLKKRLYKSTLVEQKKAKKRKKMTAAAREKARLEKEAEEGKKSVSGPAPPPFLSDMQDIVFEHARKTSKYIKTIKSLFRQESFIQQHLNVNLILISEC